MVSVDKLELFAIPVSEIKTGVFKHHLSVENAGRLNRFDLWPLYLIDFTSYTV
jgi:hypothetical protein